MSLRTYKKAMASLGGCLFTLLSFGQEGDRLGTDTAASVKLEELVVITARSNPSALIAPLDIRLRAVNNAQEVLRLVPGLFIGQHAGGGKAEQLFLRGFDIDHGTDVRLTVDGMPVNMVSHAHGQGYADLHFLIPETIETVAFEKGPYTADKGNFATAGSVDFRTRTTFGGGLAKVEYGDFNTFRGLLMGDLVQTATSTWSGAAEFNSSRGYFNAPQDFRRYNLFSRYTLNAGRIGLLSLQGSAFRSSWSASGQIPERAVADGTISYFGAIDPNEGGTTSRANLVADLATTLTSSSSFRNRVYFTQYDFDLISNFTFFLEDPVNGDRIRQQESRKMGGYEGRYQREDYLGTRPLESTIGLQIRSDATRDSELSRVAASNKLLEHLQLGHISETAAGLFLQESLTLNARWSLRAGLRLDHIRFGYADRLTSQRMRDGATLLSPKVNIFFQPSSRSQFYLSAGRGFHSNDTRVVLGQGARQALPAAHSFDLGVNLKPLPRLFLHGALWALQLQQEFVYVGDAGIVEAGGRTRRKGADLQVRYQATRALFVDADLNFSHARALDVPKGEDFIPLAPGWTATGGITYKQPQGLQGALRYRYLGDRAANEDRSLVAEGYFVTDAFAGYVFGRWEAALSAQNLFNVRWKETQFETESRLRNEASPVTEIHFTPGSPRFLKLSLSYNL